MGGSVWPDPQQAASHQLAMGSLGEDGEPATSGRGLRHSDSLFRRGRVAGITPEGRLGSVLSLRQPYAVPMLQVGLLGRV